ncbi:TPA: hypothetical protein ACG0LC_002924 [Citrobacter sedlakii]|nr:hypothetical protein [Citrobacter sedlakii]MEB0949457.1 hypothetical protein [Citrobacter sedlakii]
MKRSGKTLALLPLMFIPAGRVEIPVMTLWRHFEITAAGDVL